MPLVAAKCTQCGANIEVDDTKEAGICKYCGTAFITEKVINNYTTNITNNIVNNNNFGGANVTYQSNENIDGLLHLAKGEILSQNYDASIKYLDEIVIKSADNINIIISLFEETGLYVIAEKAIKSQDYFKSGYELAELLTKFDSDNILSWLLKEKTTLVCTDEICAGRNIIRLAEEPEKSVYEKDIYTHWIEHGSQCDAYREYFSAVPQDYIEKNIDCQNLIISIANTIHRESEYTQKNVIKSLTEMLPENRRREILRNDNKSDITSNSAGCYIATCVYGSYDCPQVWTLRRFRDYILDETWYGRLFIKCYYAISPTLVKWFGETKWFKSFWNKRLDKVVSNLNKRGIKDTFYEDKY